MTKIKSKLSKNIARTVAAIPVTYFFLNLAREDVNVRSSLRVFHNRLPLNDTEFSP